MDYYLKNNIISNDVHLFHEGVRDDKDINVYKCNKTGGVVLGKAKKTNYADNNLSYWSCNNINDARMNTYDDDYRRFKSLKNIKFNNLLDFGCGNGGLLKLIKDNNDKKEIMGIELNEKIVDYLKNIENMKIYNNLNNIPEKIKFDCVMLNHVLEHLEEPINILKKIKSRMEENSLLIIEVPHAEDYLIKMNCKAFKKFTFWSEHLILHTTETLNLLLKKAGFLKIEIKYIQRYNIFNHMKWQLDGKPGGHKTMKPQDSNLINAYNNYLIKNKMTDTLIAYCYI